MEVHSIQLKVEELLKLIAVLDCQIQICKGLKMKIMIP